MSEVGKLGDITDQRKKKLCRRQSVKIVLFIWVQPRLILGWEMRKTGGTGRTENINEVAIATLSKNGTDLGGFKSRWITEWLEVLTWIRPWSLSFTIRIQKMVLGHFFLWKIPEKESHVYFFFLDASITILTLIQSTKWQKLDICTLGVGHEQTW